MTIIRAIRERQTPAPKEPAPPRHIYINTDAPSKIKNKNVGIF
jgi:hypothetical protein